MPKKRMPESELGKFLVELYEARDFNKNQFAKALGSDYPTVHRWVTGKAVPAQASVEGIISTLALDQHETKRLRALVAHLATEQKDARSSLKDQTANELRAALKRNAELEARLAKLEAERNQTEEAQRAVKNERDSRVPPMHSHTAPKPVDGPIRGKRSKVAK